MPPSITVKELHQTTGEYVRRAGSSRRPIIVTERGKPVAVLANPAIVKPSRRTRNLPPEYEALMAKPTRGDVASDLDAVRGDR